MQWAAVHDGREQRATLVHRDLYHPRYTLILVAFLHSASTAPGARLLTLAFTLLCLCIGYNAGGIVYMRAGEHCTCQFSAKLAEQLRFFRCKHMVAASLCVAGLGTAPCQQARVACVSLPLLNLSLSLSCSDSRALPHTIAYIIAYAML